MDSIKTIVRLNYADIERWYGSVSEFHYAICQSLQALMSMDEIYAIPRETFEDVVSMHVGVLNQMMWDMMDEEPDLKAVN